MNGIKTLFLLVCFTSVSFAYNCVLKSCSPEENSEEQKCIEETTCTADGTNGCMIERHSGNTIATRHNCSSKPCKPNLYRYDGTELTIDCCFTDECNDDSMASNTVADPAVDECYSVECTTDNTESCLSNAIVEGKARVCHTPPNGDCLTSISDSVYHTSCTSPGSRCIPFEWGSYKADCCTGDLCNSPTGYTPPTDSASKVTTAYRTSTKETVESSTETVVKSSTDISEPDATTTQHTLKYSTETSGPDATTKDNATSSTDTSGSDAIITKDPSESSTGLSEPDVTTKKDTSGAGSVGQMRYVICYLVMLLLSLVE